MPICKSLCNFGREGSKVRTTHLWRHLRPICASSCKPEPNDLQGWRGAVRQSLALLLLPMTPMARPWTAAKWPELVEGGTSGMEEAIVVTAATSVQWTRKLTSGARFRFCTPRLRPLGPTRLGEVRLVGAPGQRRPRAQLPPGGSNVRMRDHGQMRPKS